MPVTVKPVRSHRDLLQFIKFPWQIYRNDSNWIPPLIYDRLQVLHPKKNPFYEHADVQLFLAHRGREVVGRISAQIDHLHLRIHKDETGFFGFFETVEDPNVAATLLDEARQWLRHRGMKTIRGPLSFSTNEESGVLVDGFEHPPMPLTGYNPSYYSDFLKKQGFDKAKDLLCWRDDPQSAIPEQALTIANQVEKYPGLKIREIDSAHLERELRIIREVFNSAWEENWGFVPLTDREIQKTARDLKIILDPHIALIAEVDDKPAAICLCLPNFYEVIRDLNGRLLPFGFLKMLLRLRRKQFRSLRLLLLGVKREYRGSILGGLAVYLCVEIHRRTRDQGYQMAELSWTLEDNGKINDMIRLMGGQHYKTYRIYEAPLT